MRPTRQFGSLSILFFTLFQPTPALAIDSDFDPLSLESAPPVAPRISADTKIYIEGALGSASQRYTDNDRGIGRASLDFSYSTRIAPGWRGVISDRLDYINSVNGGSDHAVNSLREAYLSWQSDSGVAVIEAGRINLRYGPAYGYNPTDFFRDGSLRTITSVDPFSMRENRLGSVMLRAQRLWNGGSLSVAYSPKLVDGPNQDGWSLDLGSTNNRDRVLLALGTQFSQRVSTQALAYKEKGMPTFVGVNLTALLSDAAVAHLEWSHGKEQDLQSRALALPSLERSRNRFAGGLTYTTQGKLSITAEYQYNGFAVSSSDGVGSQSAMPQSYFYEANRRQELASREAYLLYITQKSLWLKNLDLTAFLRMNATDKSRLAWMELRHRWPRVDLALALLQTVGRSASEYGVLPDRRVLQMTGTYYF